jgi:hypothetical protein
LKKKRGTGQEGRQRAKVETKGEEERTLQLLQRLHTRLRVAFSDLTWVQTHYEEMFCIFEELAGKD